MATYESVRYSFAGSLVTALQSPNMADGSVTNTEFEFINSLTSNAQTQLNTKFGSGGGTFTGNVTFNDNIHLFLGTGGTTDLDLYMDGSNGYIKNSTGNLNVNADSILFRDDGNTRNMFNATSTGAFNAYHNNTLRFSTTNGGAEVAGTLTATTLSGSGASLTTLNASNLASGTIPNARYGTPTFSGANLTSLNAANLTGQYAALDGSSITSLNAAALSGTSGSMNGTNINNLNASNLATGTVPTARLPTSGYGGKLLQLVSSNNTTLFSSTSSTFQDITNMNVVITPSNSSSKVLVSFVIGGVDDASGSNGSYVFRMLRGNTTINEGSGGTTNGCGFLGQETNNSDGIAFEFLDSPNTNTQTTYKLQVKGVYQPNIRINRSQDGSMAGTSNITAIEISG